jgi:hypothetical protein
MSKDKKKPPTAIISRLRSFFFPAHFWQEIKRGTRIGDSVRQKPYKWVEQKSKNMNIQKRDVAIKKFKRNARIALFVILCIWVCIALLISHFHIWIIVLSCVGLIFTWWVIYNSVVKSAQDKLSKK